MGISREVKTQFLSDVSFFDLIFCDCGSVCDWAASATERLV